MCGSVSAPESLLLRRKNTARLRAVRQKQLNALKKTRKSIRVAAFKRAEKYAKEYRVAQKNDIRMKRIARNTGSFYLSPEPKLAFVIRIRGYVHTRTHRVLTRRSRPIFVKTFFCRCLQLAVLTALARKCARFCSCCDCDRSTTACSFVSRTPRCK